MALMMGKYLEIKTGRSIRPIRKQLWSIHEAHLLDPRTDETHVVSMDAHEITDPSVFELLEPHFTY